MNPVTLAMKGMDWSAADKELHVTFLINANERLVRISFGAEIDWLQMTPTAARAFAEALLTTVAALQRTAQ